MPPKFVKGHTGQNRPLLGVEDNDSDDEYNDRVELGSSRRSSSHRDSEQPQENGGAISRVQGQVTEVMDVMRDNIGKVLQRGEKLDDLEEKSDHLVAGATQFRRSSNRLQKQMWWQSCRLKLILIAVVVVFIIIILIPIIIKYSNNRQSGN